jgi:spore coat-associated protein N
MHEDLSQGSTSVRRADKHERKPRRRLKSVWILLPALLLLAAAAVVASGAVFTTTSSNPGNIFASGNLSHINSKANALILSAEKMKPGDSTEGTVTIENDGDFDSTFSLATSNLADTAPNGGKLSDVLLLTIVDQSDNTELYNGPINAVPAGKAMGAIAKGSARTYKFTVKFPEGGAGDNIYKKAVMSIEFDWTQVQ